MELVVVPDPTSSLIGEIDTSGGNLVDAIWQNEDDPASRRPEVPASPFRVHPLEYAGVTVEEKMKKIRTKMTTKKATLTVFSALDDVAFLLNLRVMGDVATCPIGLTM